MQPRLLRFATYIAWDRPIGLNQTSQTGTLPFTSRYDQYEQRYHPVNTNGPILWGHSGPLCHALSSSLLWTSMRRQHATVATPGKWQCGLRWLAVANGPKIFQMLLVRKLTTQLSRFHSAQNTTVMNLSSCGYLLRGDVPQAVHSPDSC